MMKSAIIRQLPLLKDMLLDSSNAASSALSPTLPPRYKTKQILVGNVAIGGNAPISVQSMTFTKTKDIQATKEQLDRLALAGADIVRVAVSDLKDAHALKDLRAISRPTRS